MRTLLFTALVTGLLAISCAAYAYPTLAGYTGYGVLPNAAVTPAGQWDLAADFYNTDDEPGFDNTFPIRALYGVGDRFEIGAGYTFLDTTTGDDANTWSVNAKWMTPLTPLGFAWALGGRFARTDFTGVDVDTTQFYFVGTRSFTGKPANPNSVGINGSIGVNWTDINPDAPIAIFTDNNAFRLFGGVEALFSNGLSLAADIQSTDNDIDPTDDALYSVVARYPVSRAIGVEVGFTNAYPGSFVQGTTDGNFFAGLNFVFGGTANEAAK